jgi:hypothetical protein
VTADAWTLFEDAVLAPEEARAVLLDDVARVLAADGTAPQAFRAELHACVQAELAALGRVRPADALRATEAAEGHGRAGWPNYYLANALVTTGEFRLALDRLGRIPAGFFDAQGLAWRTFHCREMACIARFELGDVAGAREDVDWLARSLVARGDADDLPAPQDLVRRLVARADPDAVTLLETFAMSVDLPAWLPEQLALDAARLLATSSG